MDSIVRNMVREYTGKQILLRPHTTDPEIVREMIERGLERRQHERETADRREEK